MRANMFKRILKEYENLLCSRRQVVISNFYMQNLEGLGRLTLRFNKLTKTLLCRKHEKNLCKTCVQLPGFYTEERECGFRN